MPASGSRSRIAVLGGGGFLGSHIVPALLARRDCVVEAVDLTFDKLAVPASDRLVLTRANIDEPGVLDKVVERADTVLSLTALCNPALYNKDPLAVIDANYTDLVPLVKLCAKRGRWLLHFSTCEVYGVVALDGAGQPTRTMNEDDTGLFLGPVHKERWSYAAAKQLLERLIWAYGNHAGLRFTIVRPFNVIGPRMDFVPGVDGEGIPRVLANFMGALLRGESLPLVDGGHQRRSFICVDDFVDGILAILERPLVCQGQILNLGAPDNDVSIRGLAELMRAAYTMVTGTGAPPTQDVTAEDFYGAGYDDTRERLPDVSKATRLLNWTARTTLADMLPPIVADYVARYRSARSRAAAGAA